MIITGSVAWVLFAITPARSDQADHHLYIDIASTQATSTIATEKDMMKSSILAAGTVHGQTTPFSTVDGEIDSAAAADRYGDRMFLDVDTDTREDYGDKMSRLSRDRRALTFLDPSTLLLIFGLGTPLQLDRESVIVGAFAKIIYALPVNSTDFTEPGVYFARTKSRWSIYKAFERAAELYGFGAGKGCLLRAICEVAAAPFDLHHGLFGQMVQAFLSPSSTREPYDEYPDREYHAAESLGKHVGENCHALYPECERSVLDVFSTTAATLEEATTMKTTSTTTTTTSSYNDVIMNQRN